MVEIQLGSVAVNLRPWVIVFYREHTLRLLALIQAFAYKTCGGKVRIDILCHQSRNTVNPSFLWLLVYK